MVIVLVGILVEIVMPTGIEAQLWDNAPASAQGEQCRRILWHTLAIGPTVENLQVAGTLTVGRLVLQAHARLELILGGKVEVAHLVVDTQDGSHAPSRLVAVERHVLRGLTQGTEHGSLHAILLCLGLGSLRGSHVTTGCGILCGSRVLAHCLIGGSRLAEESLGSVHIVGAARETGADVAHVAIVVAVAIEHAQTAVGRPVLIELIGGTQREAEIILAATHVGVHVIGIDRGKSQRAQTHLARHGVEMLGKQGQQRHATLKRGQALVKMALAAATRHTKAELEAPVLPVVSCLDGRKHGSLGLALELLGGCATVVGTIGKRSEDACHCARLAGVLQIEREVKTVTHESDTCGVGVHTVDANGGIASRVAEKLNALVCVGENTTSKCILNGEHCHRGNCQF